MKMRRFLLTAALLLIGIASCSWLFLYSGEEDVIASADKEAETYFYIYASSHKEETLVRSQSTYRGDCLFVPSGMDLGALEVFFSGMDGKRVYYQDQDVTNGVVLDIAELCGDSDNCEVLFELVQEQDREDYTASFIVSDKIASVYLVSDDPEEKGQGWIEETLDHSNYASGYVYELGSDGSYQAGQKIDKLRIRGNMTADALKKSYQIKLRKKTDLIGDGSFGKNWALLANAYDNTLLHNRVTNTIAERLGVVGTPGCRSVDLYYDGYYMGNYLLSETVEAPENSRYFMQLDNTHYEEKDTYITLSNGDHIVLEMPEISREEDLEYLEELWEGALRTLDGNGVDKETGKTVEDYLDLDSYARYYLIQELTKNPDAFASSTYCYIPVGEERIYFGPVWDFDLAYGVVQDPPELLDPEGFYATEGTAAFSKLPAVRQKMAEIYENELYGIVNDFMVENEGGIEDTFEAYFWEIRDSQFLNYSIRPYNATGMTVPVLSYDESIGYFRTFLKERNEWLYQELCG